MIGRQLSHYIVEQKIGEGGMGIVYKGTDTRLRRPVALKFLTNALPAEAAERKRFLREARSASAINHPNVCIVHDIEEAEGQQFLVMEYVEGVTLRKWVARRVAQAHASALPVRDAVMMGMQIASGLEAAHKKGIVHRDVKPENIMVNDDNHAKIMDFGLAKLVGASRLTRPGATVGTVAYMSPEQVQGGEIDLRSDVYSFGVLLYEMLTGTVPFQADHVMGMMYAIVNSQAMSVGDRRSEIGPDLSRVVMKCMAKEKGHRYGSMREVMNDLGALQGGRETIISPAAPGVIAAARQGRGIGIGSGLFTLRGLVWSGVVFVIIAGGLILFDLFSATHSVMTQNATQAESTGVSFPRTGAGADTSQTHPPAPVGFPSTKRDTVNGNPESESAPLLAGSVDALAASLVRQLARGPAGVRREVAIRPFTYQDTKFGSAFSRYFKSLIELRATDVPQWRVISTEDGSGQALTVSGQGAAYEITGTYWVLPNRLRFFASLRESGTGEIARRAEGIILRNNVLMLKKQWVPGNIRRAMDDSRALGKPEAGSGDLTLELLTNKGVENLVFTEGDTLKTYIRVNKPCKVRVFYHTADGTRYALTGPEDLTIDASRVNTPVLVDMAECATPFGAEVLQAFATTERFEPIKTQRVEGGYFVLADDLQKAMVATRGIRKIGGSGNVTEKRVMITTVPK
jgi:predicted Ser/Thr protein kinase